MGLCTCFRDECFPLAVSAYLQHLVVGIIQVAEVHAFGRAYRDTCRLEPLFNPVGKAKGAFVRITIRVGVSGIIGTGCNTRPAPDTLFGYYQYRASSSVMACTSGTAANAGSVLAVIASLRPDFDLQPRIGAVGHLHHPIPAITDRNIVLCLTGNDTIAASNTFPETDLTIGRCALPLTS